VAGTDAAPLALEREPVSSGGCKVVACGQIDLYSAASFQAVLADAIDGGSVHLRVDLTAVDFVDSTGLAILAAVSNRLRRLGGSLEIVSADETLYRVFELTGLATRVGHVSPPRSV
jgi:anti-sigma B factor antagonist